MNGVCALEITSSVKQIFTAGRANSGEGEMSVSGDKDLLDIHIRTAVAVARRGGGTIALSRFVMRLRRQTPYVNIHPTYVLDQLVRAARDSDVVIEIDNEQVEPTAAP